MRWRVPCIAELPQLDHSILAQGDRPAAVAGGIEFLIAWSGLGL